MIRGTRLGLAGLFLLPGALASQALPLPGRTTLFELDPAGTPVGEFPSTIKLLTGIMSVELKDGVPMLKASSASQFLITLPRALPDRFTIEFALVPKSCCNPHDLSFEGTPAINQGLGSAHVLWDSDGYLGVIGGARDNYEVPMPEELRVTTPGVLTSVVAVVEGTTIVLYTNGRRLYTLTDRHFIRSRSLRVHLGGQDDETRAVYLAHLRVAAGSLPPAAIAGLPRSPAGRPDRAGQASSEASTADSSPDRRGLPASRIIGVSGFGGIGAPSVALRSLMLPGISGTGGSPSVPARTVLLPVTTATGPLIALSRTPVGQSVTLPPASRTILLPLPAATGANRQVVPQTISLNGWAGTGRPPGPVPLILNLAGWAGYGPLP